MVLLGVRHVRQGNRGGASAPGAGTADSWWPDTLSGLTEVVVLAGVRPGHEAHRLVMWGQGCCLLKAAPVPVVRVENQNAQISSLIRME